MIDWLLQDVTLPLYALLLLSGVGEGVRAVKQFRKRRRRSKRQE